MIERKKSDGLTTRVPIRVEITGDYSRRNRERALEGGAVVVEPLVEVAIEFVLRLPLHHLLGTARGFTTRAMLRMMRQPTDE